MAEGPRARAITAPPAIALAAHIISVGPTPKRPVMGRLFPRDHVHRPGPVSTTLAGVQPFGGARRRERQDCRSGNSARWPEEPVTAYIEFRKGVEAGSRDARRHQAGSVEKPGPGDGKAKREFVKAGNFAWNAGMFFWRTLRFCWMRVREFLPKNLPA